VDSFTNIVVFLQGVLPAAAVKERAASKTLTENKQVIVIPVSSLMLLSFLHRLIFKIMQSYKLLFSPVFQNIGASKFCDCFFAAIILFKYFPQFLLPCTARIIELIEQLQNLLALEHRRKYCSLNPLLDFKQD
jgi:hypothetical protein